MKKVRLYLEATSQLGLNKTQSNFLKPIKNCNLT